MLRTARAQAQALQETLLPMAETDQKVVGIEPSCIAALVDDHAKLMPGGASDRVAASCHEVLSFLHRHLPAAQDDDGGSGPWAPASPGPSTPVILHGHCQQKTLGWMPAAAGLLHDIPGIELHTTTSECCGMAGSFGYKSDFYGISVELGRRLAAEIGELEAGASAGDHAPGGCRTLACGTSCRSQIAQVGRREARHPVQLIDERLAKR
jgi:Fe-S oxidoreductase